MRELAPFFVIARNLMLGTLGKGHKSAKTNNVVNSTMMASFLGLGLPVIVSKKNKQTQSVTEKYVFY